MNSVLDFLPLPFLPSSLGYLFIISLSAKLRSLYRIRFRDFIFLGRRLNLVVFWSYRSGTTHFLHPILPLLSSILDNVSRDIRSNLNTKLSKQLHIRCTIFFFRIGEIHMSSYSKLFTYDSTLVVVLVQNLELNGSFKGNTRKRKSGLGMDWGPFVSRRKTD